MKILQTFLFFSFLSVQCGSQNATQQNDNKPELAVGGKCEGCEAIYECPAPFEKLSANTYLPDWKEAGPKLVVHGIVYQADGITPAPGVVLYVYHTNQQGIYPNKGNETGWGKRHGYLRGWVKTNDKGEYKFNTLQPASYPNSNAPKHIHITVKEPGKTAYYIDEFLFDEDPFLTTKERQQQPGRGGNGILTLEKKDGILYGERNIYLGRKIPGYPTAVKTGLQSGLDLGDNCPAFDPLHLTGPDSGKKVCPMCKYGYGQGIMVWFNQTNFEQLKNFVDQLEIEIQNRGFRNFRVFMVYMNPGQSGSKYRSWCQESGLKNVAMLQIPSPTDAESSGIYKINPSAKNTVFVYEKRKVAAKWVNIDYSSESLKNIMESF